MIVFLVALRLGSCPGEYSERITDVFDTGIGAKGIKGSMEEEETIYRTKCCKPPASPAGEAEAEAEAECYTGPPCDVLDQEHQCCWHHASSIAICTSHPRDGVASYQCDEANWCDSPSSSAAPTANTVKPHIAAAAAAALLLA